MKKIIASAIGAVGVLTLVASVYAGTPFRQAVTVNAGSGTFTYSSGIANQAFSAFKVDAVIYGITDTNAITLKAVYGTVTNTVGTHTPSAGDHLQTVTNDTWKTIGDKLLISTVNTNAFTAYVIGEEQ